LYTSYVFGAFTFQKAQMCVCHGEAAEPCERARSEARFAVVHFKNVTTPCATRTHTSTATCCVLCLPWIDSFTRYASKGSSRTPSVLPEPVGNSQGRLIGHLMVNTVSNIMSVFYVRKMTYRLKIHACRNKLLGLLSTAN
jgi:hypothetical protein